MRKGPYLSPGASNPKNKGTFFSSQQVDKPTHGAEILDLIFTNDQDLVSSIAVEPWPRFTDHSLVTASVSYKFGSSTKSKESHLLESGRRLKALNFYKAPWVEIQAELNEIDWSDMRKLPKLLPLKHSTYSWKKFCPFWKEMFH